MSKMDDMRAMREARYAAAQRGAGKATPKPKPQAVVPAEQAQKPVKAEKPGKAEQAVTATDELCGHRAISGRTCTREKGHAAKSHRYS